MPFAMAGTRLGAALTAALCLLAAAPAGAADTAEVHIADYKFVPAAIKIKAGTTVRWANAEKRTSHSILFLGPGGAESERIFPGESWQRAFDKPGTYPYRCGPHEEMRGVVEVVE
jgi:plastocyanin